MSPAPSDATLWQSTAVPLTPSRQERRAQWRGREHWAIPAATPAPIHLDGPQALRPNLATEHTVCARAFGGTT